MLERNDGSQNDLIITAEDGGAVDLSGLATFTDNSSQPNGRLNLVVRGAGSVLDISNVTALSAATLTVSDGGQITGQLQSLTERSSLLARGADSVAGRGLDANQCDTLLEPFRTSAISNTKPKCLRCVEFDVRLMRRIELDQLIRSPNHNSDYNR